MRKSDTANGETIDLCSEQGAIRLAARIASYWKAMGYQRITVGVRRMDVPRQKRRGDEIKEVYGVISNIVNGYPPR